MVYAKKGRGKAVADTVTIDDEVLVWEVRSEPRWTTDGYVGLRIAVRAGEMFRELMLEFPYTHTQNGRPRNWPHRPREFVLQLEDAIRLAMADGWRPESRGKTYNFALPDDPNDPSRPETYR